MKSLACLNLVALCLSFVAGSAEAQSFRSLGYGEGDNQTTLIVKADGSCAFTNEAVQPRRSLEIQVTSWERYSKMAEGLGSEDEEAATFPPQRTTSAPKSLTNEELAAKLREMYQQRPDYGEDDALKVENVVVSTNSVRLVTSRSFASLKELLSQSLYTWGPTALMFEDARAEIDTNRNLRLTFTPAKGTDRYAKEMARGWKSSKTRFAWKLVLPGKILSSGLPGTQDNATWLSLDGEKPDTVDAALKLMGPPLVITAEPAGIKLDEPLDSKKLVRAAWKHRKSEPDLPITDAGPGFLAEPVSLTLSTVHTFPEGEKYFKDRPEASMLGMDSPGTVVSAKLFPPKGRQIRSVSGLHVKSAKDDKGRAIPGAADGSDNQEDFREFTSYSSGDSEKGGAARIEIRLALPAPDAKTIDALEAEAVALTIGGWKELVLTNVQADAKKEIDLGEVLPGAKLIIKKIGGRRPQKSIEASLEGPPAVNQLEVKIKSNSRQGGQSNLSERRSTTSGNKTTRNVTIQAYEFERGEEAKNAPLTLVVRYPQDVKRERVQFKLTALDLL